MSAVSGGMPEGKDYLADMPKVAGKTWKASQEWAAKKFDEHKVAVSLKHRVDAVYKAPRA